ncbi:MAG: pimeloyl-ACP methyl ester carboxylesterase, partial [Candidatus Azotimanducaceae bacterium]
KPNSDETAISIICQLSVPTLALVGEFDIPYMHAALDYMDKNISGIKTAMINNSAHVLNMDQAQVFRDIVVDFLKNASSRQTLESANDE